MADDDIAIDERDGIIRVVYRGRVRYDSVERLLREVVRIASESGGRRILFDVRDAQYSNYHIETIQHAERGRVLGLDSTYRIAFLGSADEPMLRYIENVSINRGYQVKAFTEEDAADGWLRQT